MKAARGSSPLARGTRAPSPGGTRSRTVHPRSRGEHFAGVATAVGVAGSSPLARGTRPRNCSGARPPRFIPARAGNTPTTPRSAPQTPVHPRSRGEHLTPQQQRNFPDGSSPLARGTRDPLRRGDGRARFIPARAGNTHHNLEYQRSTAVHPRSRGEHDAVAPPMAAEVGSSPLARGTPGRQRDLPVGDRFIPARAGNTRPSTGLQLHSTVHPRSRGEHPAVSGAAAAFAGSSPLARGTLFPQLIDI